MKNANIPILITGAQRSGTTWVGRTLSQHPFVRYEHEPFNAFYPNRMFGVKLDTLYSHYESSRQQAEITRAFNRLLFAGKIVAALTLCKATGISRKTPQQFFKQLFLTPRQRILVKDPIALLSAGWLYDTYHFQVICMIRSPFAFVGSQKKAGWDMDFDHLRRQDALMHGWLREFADEIEYFCTHRDAADLVDRAALWWKVLHAVILKYKHNYPDWLFLTHEDVATNPETAFRNIFDYLGLELTDDVQDYISEYTSSRHPAHARSPKYQPRDSKAVPQAWKEILSSDEISRVARSTKTIATQLYGDIDLTA